MGRASVCAGLITESKVWMGSGAAGKIGKSPRLSRLVLLLLRRVLFVAAMCSRLLVWFDVFLRSRLRLRFEHGRYLICLLARTRSRTVQVFRRVCGATASVQGVYDRYRQKTLRGLRSGQPAATLFPTLGCRDSLPSNDLLNRACPFRCWQHTVTQMWYVTLPKQATECRCFGLEVVSTACTGAVRGSDG